MAATQGWHRVDPDDLPADGRVRAVTVGGHVVALARCGGQLGALDNRCPHQGGPWVRVPRGRLAALSVAWLRLRPGHRGTTCWILRCGQRVPGT